MTATVKVFVVADLVIYLFYVLAPNVRGFMEDHLALGPRLFKGELWQPVTSLFTHITFLGFLFSVIGLWFVGSVVEQLRGARRFLTLFFTSGVLTNITIAGVWHLRGKGPIPFTDGCIFVVIALFIAFTRAYGRQQVQFWPTTLTVQARTMAFIMIGLSAATFAAQHDWHLLAGLPVAVATGYFGAGPGGLTALRTFFANARDAARARRIRRRFGVIEGGERPPKKKYVN
ncbi:MAG TPA: rhomboid family intramembrane serine protease [Polyangia bacterium]|nr:rhomboid family intramembrane serine protease [Polyangia bacterium]